MPLLKKAVLKLVQESVSIISLSKKKVELVFKIEILSHL